MGTAKHRHRNISAWRSVKLKRSNGRFSQSGGKVRGCRCRVLETYYFGVFCRVPEDSGVHCGELDEFCGAKRGCFEVIARIVVWMEEQQHRSLQNMRHVYDGFLFRCFPQPRSKVTFATIKQSYAEVIWVQILKGSLLLIHRHPLILIVVLRSPISGTRYKHRRNSTHILDPINTWAGINTLIWFHNPPI